MKKVTLILIFLLFQSLLAVNAQDKPAKPLFTGTGTFLGTSRPLRDLPAMTPAQIHQMELQADDRERNEDLNHRSYPFASSALPKGPDPVWQQMMGTTGSPRAPIANFDGQTSPYYPPDCNGTAGPNHFMQTINCVYAIYNKAGAVVAGPTNMNLLFSGVPGSNYNDGDPIILYDEQADRWFVTEFSISGSTNYILMAVSVTNDPTGSWYTYSFVVDAVPDYPKFSIWQDGYYMGDNNSSTKDIYVFERSKILQGLTAQYVGFNNPNRPASLDGFMCVPPVDNDGAFAPAGSPGLFIAFNDDAIGGGSDQLWIYELAVNWTTPASSTFSRVQQLTVPAFDSDFGSTWDNIVQPGTSQKLDAIPQVVMNVPQYRNFNSYQTIVCCHTVDVDQTNHAGIRWYELRKTSGSWTLRQSGTYAPDVHSRWMGSIMLNPNNKIALGYSVSSSTVYPSIRYTGQSAGAYVAGAGILDIPEEVIINGANTQSGYNRWGDYSQMCVDPADNETFWFTSEYIGPGGTRKTRIASFKFGNAPTIVTLPATSVTLATATLNGTVNPNGLVTSYHFEYGTSVSYGNSTTTGAAGSGTSAVNISADLTGLIPGTTYHFRAVGVNTDGTTNGQDLTFAPGAASVTTTAASAITTNSATSGGNVTTDGGSAVTARGVCWATTANPIVTGNHTTDGSGTGVFISSITGLSAVTAYHVRAYATNSNGTFYGDDLQFTTLCGTIISLPFSEGFEGGAVRPACWSEENANPAWQFLTGNGSGYPANAHTGTYNACLKDNTSASNKNKLITPVFDLSGYINVQLKFWHTQALWTPDQDVLRIYYRTSATGTWNLLQTYTQNITTWTEETINLTTISSTYQIAFEGDAMYGRGVCIDDILVTGTSGINLVVTPANQDVTPPAGTTTFSVTCPIGWTAVCDATSWCTVTPSGTGNGSIVATYTENATTTPRIANITVSATGAPTKIVTVTQSGITPTLTVVPLNQDVPAPAGSTTFSLTSNADWTVSSNVLWCLPTPSTGNGDGTITATYEVNTDVLPRIATFTFVVSGLPAFPVTVTQAGAAAVLSVIPPNQDVTAISGVTEFTVTSNSSWTVSSNMTWCTPNPASGNGNGTISASYLENPDVTSRMATLTISAPGVTAQTVTVTQAGTLPLLSVTPANQDVTALAGNTSFDVTSNTTWNVLSEAPWCTVTNSGSGNGTIQADYTENVTYSLRTANISVTVAGITPLVVTVTQEASVVSANDMTKEEIRIFPNPNTGLFEIITGKLGLKEMEVTILDYTGKVTCLRKCSGSKRYSFDLSGAPKGCYFVKIKAEQDLMIVKVTII